MDAAVPKQRCGSEGVTWSVTPDDFDGLSPQWLLGGTFQSAAPAALSRPDDFGLESLIPSADCLHFVLVHGDPETQLRAFVRAGGQLKPVGQQPVMVNDWAAALIAAMPRLAMD